MVYGKITDLWLGYKYKKGEDIIQSFTLAYEHFRKSAERGNKTAMIKISKLYLNNKIDIKLTTLEETLNFFNYKQF